MPCQNQRLPVAIRGRADPHATAGAPGPDFKSCGNRRPVGCTWAAEAMRSRSETAIRSVQSQRRIASAAYDAASRGNIRPSIGSPVGSRLPGIVIVSHVGAESPAGGTELGTATGR